eukprot:scaffold188319_cov18-Tisochrysis_lutea.AAC.1
MVRVIPSLPSARASAPAAHQPAHHGVPTHPRKELSALVRAAGGCACAAYGRQWAEVLMHEPKASGQNAWLLALRVGQGKTRGLREAYSPVAWLIGHSLACTYDSKVLKPARAGPVAKGELAGGASCGTLQGWARLLAAVAGDRVSFAHCTSMPPACLWVPEIVLPQALMMLRIKCQLPAQGLERRLCAYVCV